MSGQDPGQHESADAKDQQIQALTRRIADLETTARRGIEAELRQAREELQKRVAERTRELEAVNQRLQQVIAEHEATEARLRSSERTLADAQRLAHLGSWERDLTTGLSIWSDEQHRIMGTDPGAGAANLDVFMRLVHPDDVPAIRAYLERLYQTDAPLDYVHRVARPDGQVRTVAGIMRLIRDADGKPARIVGTSQDVTESLAAKRQIEDTLQRLRNLETIINRSPAVVCQWRQGPRWPATPSRTN